MIYRIAVCDDDEEQLFYLSRLLREWGERRQRLLKIEAYRSAESFLPAVRARPALRSAARRRPFFFPGIRVKALCPGLDSAACRKKLSAALPGRERSCEKAGTG